MYYLSHAGFLWNKRELYEHLWPKIVVGIDISYIKSLVRHLISKLLTGTFFILFIVSQIVLYHM